jgi:hypothetical protein
MVGFSGNFSASGLIEDQRDNPKRAGFEAP